MRAPARTRRFHHAEFARLARLRFFHGERVELIGGRIIDMPPQRDVHAAAVSLARDAAAAAFGPGYWVRMQLPLRLGRWSGPEPGISVVTGSARDYVGTGHPRGALLVIEVSDTTLRYDRRLKAGLYAKHGIAEYWIVNLIDRRIERHRDPMPDASHPFCHRYTTVEPFQSGHAIQALAAPTAPIRVDDLLP